MTKATLGDIGKRIITLVIGVALDAQDKEPRLHPLNHVLLNAQAAIYWLRMVAFETTDGGIEEGGEIKQEVQVELHPPTLFGTKEHLEFIDAELKKLVTDLTAILDNTYLTPQMTYNIQRAYDKLHEALFSNELAINYYGKYSRR